VALPARYLRDNNPLHHILVKLNLGGNNLFGLDIPWHRDNSGELSDHIDQFSIRRHDDLGVRGQSLLHGKPEDTPIFTPS